VKGHSLHDALASESHQRNPYAGPVKETTPAHLLSADSSPLSEQIIGPVRNGWIVGSHARQTIVWAGGGGYGHLDDGRFAILRDGFVHVSQQLDTIDVAGAGPLKITDAPVGRGVPGSIQGRAQLGFTSESGIGGTLDLKDDTVTLSP
jgi:hypothetical protein